MLNELGYESRSISEGLAVVYGEMENSNYTGIGISCGGGLVQRVPGVFVSAGIQLQHSRKAGDYIDASVSQLRGEPATRIRTIKEESFHFNGHFREQNPSGAEPLTMRT